MSMNEAASDLLLYVDAQYVSPYAMSAFVALHEKQLPFEIRTTPLRANGLHATDFVADSLTRRVPTLLHRDFALTESSAITEYLDEQFGGTRLYPTEPRQRARARQVQAWLRSDLMALRDERPTEVIFYRPVSTPLSAAGQDAADKLIAIAQSLLVDDAEYLCDSWCVADVDLALMLNRLILNREPVPARLAAYAARQWQRPSVQRWVKQIRPPLL